MPVSTTLNFVFVSAGGSHTCGMAPPVNIDTTGYIPIGICWGENTSGQLGNGTLTNSSVPVAILTTSVYVLGWGNLSTGYNHTCGGGIQLKGNGKVPYPVGFCRGDNASGELGDGTTTNNAVPVNNLYFGGEMSAGTGFSCQSDQCWGNNSVGQLGNGTMTNSSVPVTDRP